jgi:hypothetical protein
MIEYDAAGRSLDEELQWEYAQEIGEATHARAEWLEKRPEVKAQLEDRRQPPN